MRSNAIHLGNGLTGAVFSSSSEGQTLMTNHCGLWIPGVSQNMPHIPQDGSNPLDAYSRYQQTWSKESYRPSFDQYMPGFRFSLSITQAQTQDTTLDFISGYLRCVCGGLTEQCFVSRKDDVIALHLKSAGQQELCFDFSAALPSGPPQGFTLHCKAEGQYLYGEATKPNGWQYGFVAKAVCSGGTLICEGESLAVRGAQEALVLISLYPVGNANEYFFTHKAKLDLLGGDFDTLFQRHMKVLEQLNLPAPESYEDYKKQAAFSGDSLPLSGGLWNDSWTAPFYTLDVDDSWLETFPVPLAPVLYETLRGMTRGFAENAEALYSCPGYFVPRRTDRSGGRFKELCGEALYNTRTGGILALLLLKYGKTARDTAFLDACARPFVSEVLRFYDALLEKGWDALVPMDLAKALR